MRLSSQLASEVDFRGLAPRYIKPVNIVLKGHPGFDEPWLGEGITNDQSILGLGEVGA